jgi:uncharacterized coiled-coil DUF342 family protein
MFTHKTVYPFPKISLENLQDKDNSCKKEVNKIKDKIKILTDLVISCQQQIDDLKDSFNNLNNSNKELSNDNSDKELSNDNSNKELSNDNSNKELSNKFNKNYLYYSSSLLFISYFLYKYSNYSN